MEISVLTMEHAIGNGVTGEPTAYCIGIPARALYTAHGYGQG